jgi:UDP-N-acetylmuramyl pentapeptide synthase
MLTYGFSEQAQVRGSYMAIDYDDHSQPRIPIGMIFRVDWQGSSVPVRLPGVLGEQPCMAALAALAVGLARGESLVRMSEVLGSLPEASGRMHIIEGKNGSTIIDDSYNASPVAVEAALRTLETTKGVRKIALLGDMLELGQYEEEEHRNLGSIAAKIVDELVVVGKRAQWIAEAAQAAGLSQGNIHAFATSIEAGEWLSAQISSGDIILVKGSQGSGENMIRMERAIKLLMAHPEEASKLLVRQEKEWQQQY